MQHDRDGLIPIGEAFSGLDGGLILNGVRE